MARAKHHKQKRRQRTNNPAILPGAEPGMFTISGEECPLITVFSYNPQTCSEREFKSTEALFKHLGEHKELQHWIDISGYGNENFFDHIGDYFNLHALQLEDVVGQFQRPKVEEFDDHVFIISRMKYNNKDGVFIDEQISLFVFEKIVLSFQDYDEDCLQPVRERLRKENTRIRLGNTFFLAYSIQDAIVDNYFPLIDAMAARLEELEDEVIKEPHKETIYEIQEIKRQLIDLRKSIWPEKDKMNELIRTSYHFVLPEYGIYLRDTYDHCVQIMDLIETNKEIAHSIMDMYLNTVNNKLSEVMKVLTVISSVFIPLTFIAGVYGMNFSSTGRNGETLPWNMPELFEPWGYIVVLALMLIIAIGQIIFFRRKKWL